MKAATIIKKHYGLNREVTPAEVLMELWSLNRKENQGTLDDPSHFLQIQLEQAGAAFSPADQCAVDQLFLFFCRHESPTEARIIMLDICQKKFQLTEEQAKWWYDRWRNTLTFKELPMG